MKIVCDTSILVEIDRGNEKVVELLQKAVKHNHELLVSTITVAEIFTGSYLRKDTAVALGKAKEVLNQFLWNDVNGEVAEYCAKLYAYLLLEKKGNAVEYQDIIIAATYLSTKSDILLTLNAKDFRVFPQIKQSVFTPEEWERKI